MSRTDCGSFWRYKDGREKCKATAAGKGLYSFRIYTMVYRQINVCPLCGKWLWTAEATFEHQAGRGMGGSHQDDRIEVDGEWQNAAVHLSCNSLKGSKRYSWQLIDGQRRYLPVAK